MPAWLAAFFASLLRWPDGTVIKVGNELRTTSSGGALALDDLSDVSITGASDGQVLTYDAGTSQWINADPTGGGGDCNSGIAFTRFGPHVSDPQAFAGQPGAFTKLDYV